MTVMMTVTESTAAVPRADGDAAVSQETVAKGFAALVEALSSAQPAGVGIPTDAPMAGEATSAGGDDGSDHAEDDEDRTTLPDNGVVLPFMFMMLTPAMPISHADASSAVSASVMPDAMTGPHGAMTDATLSPLPATGHDASDAASNVANASAARSAPQPEGAAGMAGMALVSHVSPLPSASPSPSLSPVSGSIPPSVGVAGEASLELWHDGAQPAFMLLSAREDEGLVTFDDIALGRVAARIATDDGGARIDLFVEQAESAALLQNHLEDLTQALDDAGLRLESAHVSTGHRGRPPPDWTGTALPRGEDSPQSAPQKTPAGGSLARFHRYA